MAIKHPRIDVKRTVKIKLSLTADDWQLYGRHGDEEYKEREDVARALNQAVELALNGPGPDHERVARAFRLLDQMTPRRFGAADTEGRGMLHEICHIAGIDH